MLAWLRLFVLLSLFPFSLSQLCLAQAREQAPEIELKVSDAESGAPVKSFRSVKFISSDLERDGDLDGFKPFLFRSENGVYRLPLGDEGIWGIGLSAEGYAPAWFLWKEPETAKERRDVYSGELLLRKGSRIGGMVVDEEGKPVPNVGISISCSFKDDSKEGDFVNILSETVESSPDGHWSAAVDGERASELCVSLDEPAPGYAWELPSLDVDELFAGNARIVLKRGVELKGRVLNPDGSPAEGAKLEIKNRRGVAISGKDGSFLLHALPLGGERPFRVFAEKDGAANKTVDAVSDGNGAFKPLEIRLEACSKIEGRIVDGEGNALEGVEIRRYERLPDPRFPDDLIGLALESPSGKGGGFFVGNVPPEGVILRFSKKGFDSANRKFAATESPVEIKMAKWRVLAISVTDASTGSPVDKFSVDYSSDEGCTHFTSKYRPRKSPYMMPISEFFAISGCKKANVDLTLAAPGYSTQKRRVLFRRDGPAETPIEFKLEPVKVGSSSGE